MASAPMEGARAAAGFAPPPGERRGGEEGEPLHRAGSGDGEGRAAPAIGKKEIEGGRERVRRRGDHRSGVCGGERRYVSTVGPTMWGERKVTVNLKISIGGFLQVKFYKIWNKEKNIQIKIRRVSGKKIGVSKEFSRNLTI